MANDRLEFRITKDENNQHIELENMSLDVSKSFLVIIQAVTRIVELTPRNKDLSICIKKGSAVVSVK
ncbi:MAG: hypothetical protein EOP48_32910, partial [Sphingobacteriales bacterium]